MRIIYNNVIPFRGFAAINLFGTLFVRRGTEVSPRLLTHEAIHTEQMKETLYVPFYLWYLAEWLVRLFMKGSAYRNISFEREAYAHEADPTYPVSRGRFAWTRCLRKRKERP